MNRFITMILTVFMTLGFTSFPAHADVIGEVIATDITAYIDEQPIASFNINGFTYVIAEDLRSYGFTVLWDENARTLRIYRSAENSDGNCG